MWATFTMSLSDIFMFCSTAKSSVCVQFAVVGVVSFVVLAEFGCAGCPEDVLLRVAILFSAARAHFAIEGQCMGRHFYVHCIGVCVPHGRVVTTLCRLLSSNRLTVSKGVPSVGYSVVVCVTVCGAKATACCGAVLWCKYSPYHAKDCVVTRCFFVL